MNNALNNASTSGRPRRSAAVAARANITANIRRGGDRQGPPRAGMKRHYRAADSAVAGPVDVAVTVTVTVTAAADDSSTDGEDEDDGESPPLVRKRTKACNLKPSTTT